MTAADDAQSLIGKYEGIKAQRKMRFVGKTAADAKRVANLAIVLRGSECNVVDLGIGAPGRAPGDGDFEFARQVVELRIGGEQMGNLNSEGRGIDDLIVGYSGEGAAGHVSYDVAACAFGREADGVERVDNLRKRFDGEPMELDVLANGDVGKVLSVFARELADGAKLAG